MRIKNTFWVRLLIAFVLGAPSYLFFIIIRNFPFDQVTTYAYIEYSSLVFLAFLSLFEIHNWKSKWLEKKRAWKQNFKRRLLVEILISVLLPIPIVLIFYSFLYLVLWDMGLYSPSIVMYCAYVTLFSLIFMIFVNANYIIEDWRKSIIKGEALEKENVKAKLEALQTQLSPHFLFNNLNIIDALVEKDSQLAQRYVQGLSKVFRYILDNKNRELISLEEELSFIEEFMFLMETRFDKNIALSVSLSEKSKRMMVPPVSLQLLVENAVKHNEISIRNPLLIEIDDETNHYLTIRNNVKPRKSNTTGTGTGLKNIRERYHYLTDNKVVVNAGDTHFEIKIPLLQIHNA